MCCAGNSFYESISIELAFSIKNIKLLINNQLVYVLCHMKISLA